MNTFLSLVFAFSALVCFFYSYSSDRLFKSLVAGFIVTAIAWAGIHKLESSFKCFISGLAC